MKKTNRFLGLAMLAVFLGVGTSQASVQATFHLPVATHWGKTVLAPGDYKLLVQDGQSNLRNVVIQGEGRTVFAMPLVADANASTAAHSHLELVQRDGAYFIKEYCSQVEGKTYLFGVPKNLSPEKSITVEIKN